MKNRYSRELSRLHYELSKPDFDAWEWAKTWILGIAIGTLVFCIGMSHIEDITRILNLH
jgi:hypothetical protein